MYEHDKIPDHREEEPRDEEGGSEVEEDPTPAQVDHGCEKVLEISEKEQTKNILKLLPIITSKSYSVFKGIVQPFELGGVTSLIRSAVRFCKAGHFQKKFLMIQSHERSLKQNSAA